MRTTLNVCGRAFAGVIHRTAYLESGAAALLFNSEDGERIATLSVNLQQPLPSPNHTFIKDYSENEGVLAQLVAQNIVRDTGQRAASGFVTVPLVEIVEPSLRK